VPARFYLPFRHPPTRVVGKEYSKETSFQPLDVRWSLMIISKMVSGPKQLLPSQKISSSAQRA